jgi:hypothetical protein
MEEATEVKQPHDPPKHEAVRVLPMLLLASLAVGVLLRVFQYAVNRSLWLDEALLAKSVLTRGFAELAEPLLYGQTAPLGFLLMLRGAVEVFGSSELSLRLTPLVAGLLGLACFRILARETLADRDSVVATALFALSPYLIYYSSEVKQYSSDVLASVLLLLFARRVLDSDSPVTTRLLPLAMTGVVVVWVSHPSIFFLTAIGAVILWRTVVEGGGRPLALVAATGMAWVASFGASYLVANRGLADREYMEAFWRMGFWPLPPSSMEEADWLPRALIRMLREPIGVLSDQPAHSVTIVIAGGITLLLGAVLSFRQNRAWGAVCLLPFVLVLIASAMKMYPFGGGFPTGGRVLLFLLPIAFVWIAVGAGAMLDRARPLGMVLVAMLVAPYVLYAAQSVPHVRMEVKPLLEYVREEWQPGDRLYVYYDGRAQFAYYGERYGFQSHEVILGSCSRFDPSVYLTEMAALSGTPRLWVLFVGSGHGAHAFDERGLILTGLDRLGRRLGDQVAIGTSVYLYDLRGANASELNGIQIPILPYNLAFDCRGPWAHD